VKGVGPITSLAHVLTLEDPQRFSSSREVGPYLGLVPKQEDSGDSQPQLGINAKKRAVVAVARKLAVLLHHLWVSGDVYEPLHHSEAETRTAQATAA